MSSAIKSTFIALIPKTDGPSSFDDFRPISLCNCLYKIIAKIIANRLKPILSQHISSEQFAFLHHRQIHEAIASAQELIHTLQSKKKKGMILKIDLSKAFDRANWLYLRLLLTHLGFPYEFIKWTMSCITDVTYSVLLNGEATPFFTSERGLRQGCPLSPLLFLLIMEGLSRIISSARGRHHLTGIKIVDNLFLNHLLFVDDILIFLNGSIGDSTALHGSILLFQQTTGMLINNNKSTITMVGCSIHESAFASQRFPFTFSNLADGIKYLGFRLKPSGYKIADWMWLITKVEKRLQDNHHHISNIWKAVIDTLPLLWEGITWHIKEGNFVRIGMDPWVRCGNTHRLHADLIRHLHDRGVTHIKHIGDRENSSFLHQAWLSARALELPHQWTNDWMAYTSVLTQAQIRLTEGPDEIIWAFAKNGIYTPKLGYLRLKEPYKPRVLQSTWRTIWKLKAAPRTRLLMWNILFDKIPTSNNLMKRSFHGPFRCHLCLSAEESTEHLFLSCSTTLHLWQSLSSHIPHLNWHGNNLPDAWGNWCCEHLGKSINLPLLACWAIWIARNQTIFNHKAPHWPSITFHTIADYNMIPEESQPAPPRNLRPVPIDKSIPWAFFDGSAQEDACRGGAILHLNDRHCYKIKINLGRGTNNYAELCAAKHIIHFAIQKQCRHLQLFGDSKIICNWLNNASHCHSYTLRHILDEAKRLTTFFESFVCRHIYREHNTVAYQLSKEAAHRVGEDWSIQEEVDGTYYQYYHRILMNR
eukprot:PITA_34809